MQNALHNSRPFSNSRRPLTLFPFATLSLESMATLTLGENVVNQLERSLFVGYGKKKEAFVSSLSTQPKDDFEVYTRPFMITDEDKNEETNLSTIVSRAKRDTFGIPHLSTGETQGSSAFFKHHLDPIYSYC